MIRKLIVTLGTLITFLLLFTSSAQAAIVDAISLGVGKGCSKPLYGGRVSAQWDWHRQWLKAHDWYLGGYWDLNLARWWARAPARNNRFDAITIVGLLPVFRFQRVTPYEAHWSPYVEIGVGVAGMSRNYLGDRNLGSRWTFQDTLGTGVRFGQQQQYDLGVHYFHYSNANFAQPNQGIDVKLLVMFSYHFA